MARWRETCVGRHQSDRTARPAAEAVLRCALLKQYRQLSYQELAFHLEDSASLREPTEVGAPKNDQGAIRPEIWEQINRTRQAGSFATAFLLRLSRASYS